MSASALRFAPRVNATVLLLLAERATPGPWDAFHGWVSSVGVSPDPTLAANNCGRDSEDSHNYYGGALVCESCDRADALLIAAMRNAVPELAQALLDGAEEIKALRQSLLVAHRELEEERDLVKLVRSERYNRPRFALVSILPGAQQ